MYYRNKIIKKVSVIGIITNLILMILKLIGGIFSKSSALIADSLHSAEDMLASILSCIGSIVSSKKANEKYIFGFGKTEYIFSFLISIFMIITSITLIISSVTSIINKEVICFSKISILVCVITIFVKFVLYIYTKIQYKKTNSILIKSIKLDHRNDICISIATLIGVIFSYFGIAIIDSILAILIAILIGVSGVKIFITSFQILMDKGITKEQEEEIKEELLKNKEVVSVEKVISKPIGSTYILIICLIIDSNNNLDFEEQKILNLKCIVKNRFSNIKEVYIETKKNKCVDI